MAKPEVCVCVKTNDIFGRYLVAARDIKQGELLLLECPAAVGPRIDSSPLCLGCWTPVAPFPQAGTCPRCNVAPLCSRCRLNFLKTAHNSYTSNVSEVFQNDLNTNQNGEHQCAQHQSKESGSMADVASRNKNEVQNVSVVGHTDKECVAYMNSKLTNEILMQNMQIVLPLRILLLDGPCLHTVLDMEAHLEKRRNTGIWQSHLDNVNEVLYDLELITREQYPPEVLNKISGILDVNTFELRVTDTTHNSFGHIESVRGLFPEAAMLAHDCVGNTHICIDNAFNMRVYASVPMKKDETIYFNYTNVLQPTWKRREHLREGKYFECGCARCSDATEMGTYLGAILCLKCKSGQVTPVDPLNASPWIDGTFWLCGECAQGYPSQLVLATMQQVHRDMMGLDKTSEREIETMLKKLAKTLSSQHYLILDLKQTLAGLLRDISVREINPPKRVLQRKLQLCREMVPLLNILEPGISRLRGIALYEMHIPIVQLANREYESHDIAAADLLIQFKEAESCLREAVSLLLYDHVNTPEGKLTRRALEELRALRGSIEKAQELVHNENNDARNKADKKRGGGRKKNK